MFLAIGERINATRKNVAAAILARDEDYVRSEIERQISGGALMLDVNGGTNPEDEPDNMLWLMDFVARNCEVPLCVDSANPEVIESGIETCLRARGGSVPGNFEVAPGLPWMMINSISAEAERYEQVLPLVKKYNCAVVALCMGDGNPPITSDERVGIGTALVDRLAAEGVQPERIYSDPLVLPLGVDTQNALATRDTVAELKRLCPGVRTVCGLSNVSFGLPARQLINRTFLMLLISAGLDAAIIDTSDAKLMSSMRAALALCNRDQFCADYITAFRKNKLVV